MGACDRCGAPLSTPLGCASCGTLAPLGRDASPFALFGLRPAFEVDRAALHKRLLELSRLVHPDYFATAAPEQRELAERGSAALNRAHAILSDDTARADWLITHHGGPKEGEIRDMPRSFLMQVMEWNEALEEARNSATGSPPRARLANLRDELQRASKETLERVASLIGVDAPTAEALAEARRHLNAQRYLARALHQLDELRAGHVSSR